MRRWWLGIPSGLAIVATTSACLVAEPDLVPTPASGFEPLDHRTAQALADKAAWHEDRITRRHLTPDGLLAYQADSSRADFDVSPTGYPDMAIWSGLYLAAESMRYAVTADPAGLERIDQLIGGLSLLHHVTQAPGFVARAVRRETDPPGRSEYWKNGTGAFSRYQWLADTSVDQFLGVMYGYGWAFDATDDPARRDRISREVSAIVDRIVANGMQIKDGDGRRVKHGDLTAGLFAENLNSLIALALVKTAAHVAPDGGYEAVYRDLADRRGYAKDAEAARDRWWEVFTGVNHSDNNLAILAYDALLRYEDDAALRNRYLAGLRRTWNVSKREGNALTTWVAAAHGVPIGRTGERLAIASLMDFPLEQRNVETMNSRRPDVCVSPRPDRTGDPQACEPLPISERPRGPFEWNQNPYRLDRKGGGQHEYSGLGYLTAYWLGRRVGAISAP